MINRSGAARVPDDVEVIGGNAADPSFCAEVSRGAAVVYQTLNPPYARWTEEFPGLQAGVLAGAEAAGARFVSMENVYMYGRPAGRPLTETREYAAHTKKGRLRGEMARGLLAAHQAGRVEVAIGRASDYFGPRGGVQSNLGDRLVPAALAGSPRGAWSGFLSTGLSTRITDSANGGANSTRRLSLSVSSASSRLTRSSSWMARSSASPRVEMPWPEVGGPSPVPLPRRRRAPVVSCTSSSMATSSSSSVRGSRQISLSDAASATWVSACAKRDSVARSPSVRGAISAGNERDSC